MRIGVGCVNLGSASRGHSPQADVRLVREAVDRGIDLFDTADIYGSGASERILGKALGTRRADVTIATKGGYRFRPRSGAEQAARRLAAMAKKAIRRGGGGGGGGAAAGGGGSYQEQDFTPAYLRTAVEASLRRLRTDHIDVYQLHGPHAVTPDLFEQLQDLVAAGKVGRFGVGAESVEEAEAWLAVAGVEVVQLPFGILDPEAAGGTLALAADRGVEVWARGVLGGGLLAAAVGDSTPIHHHPKRPLILRLQEVAARHDIGLDRLAVGFARPYVSTMVVGVTTTSHLHRDLDLVAAGPLDPAILADVDAVLSAHRAADG